MSEQTWSETAVLGAIAPFHLDPCVGGPPLASPDGHWWWNGGCWCPREVSQSPADLADVSAPLSDPLSAHLSAPLSAGVSAG